MTSDVTSKNIEMLDDYFVDLPVMEREASYAWVVRVIASVSKGKLRVGSLHHMLEDSRTAPRFLIRGRASALLGGVADMHGLRLGMKDGALVMVENEVPPTAPQKTKGRPRRTDPSQLEKLVGEHSKRMRLEDFAKLLDDEKVPLTKTLDEKVRSWKEAVKGGHNSVRHDVQKCFSNIRTKYSKHRV